MQPRRLVRGLGTAGLALILVGSSAVLTAAASGAVVPATAPGNDNFASAQAISSLPANKVVDVTDATTEGSERMDCGMTGQTVWYSYTPGSDTLVGLDTRGSNVSAVITIYTGTTLATLSEHDCDSRTNGNAADLVLPATGGTTYWFQVGVYSNDHAGHSLHFNVVALTPPSNDASTTPLTVGTLPYKGPIQDIRGATNDSEPVSNCAYQQFTVWYRFTPTKSQTVRVDNLKGDFLAAIAIYRGAGLTLDSCTNQSSVSFRAVKGTTYSIQVGANTSNLGNVRLRLRAVSSPSNDTFSTPKSIGTVPTDLTGNTTAATLQKNEPQACDGWVGGTVWYTFKPASTGNYRFESTNSMFEEVTAIFSGSSVGGLSPIGCGGPIVARLTNGQTYRVAIGGSSGGNGQFKVHVSRGTPPSNDNIASAKNVSLGAPFSESISTLYATNQVGEADPSCSDVPNNSVWYSFTPSSNAVVRVQTLGSSFDTILAAYSGPNPGSLTQVGCDDDSRLPEPEYLHSSIAFHVAAGTRYWVQAGGYSFTSGTLKIKIQTVTPPANDDFANAITVADGYSATGIDSSKATVEPGEPSGCTGGADVNGATFWYAFHATTTNDLTFTATNTSSTPIISVYSGTDINSLTEVDCHYGTETWTPTSGTDYRIQISGQGGAVGLIDVTFSAP